jgi:ABC-type amino acid transport system permease subunit
MPFSFSNISSTALIFMVLCLTVAEIVKYLGRHYSQSKKNINK